MAHSLKNRFKGMETEVVSYAKEFGKGPAMRKYGISDYLAFTKFLSENGLSGSTPILPGDDVLSSIVGTFTKTLLAYHDEIARLRQEVSELRKVADTRKVQKRQHEESVALDFLNFCNSPIPEIDDDILGIPVEI